MTTQTTCSCGCVHSVNSDIKDLLTGSRKCFICGSAVTFHAKVKEPEVPADSAAPTADMPKRRGRHKGSGAAQHVEKKRRGRPRKQ